MTGGRKQSLLLGKGRDFGGARLGHALQRATITLPPPTQPENKTPPPQKQQNRSGEAEARPGVARLIDEARAAGIAVAACSGAAPRAAVAAALDGLLGRERAAAVSVVVGAEDVAAAAAAAKASSSGSSNSSSSSSTATSSGGVTSGSGAGGGSAFAAAAATLGLEPAECLAVTDGLEPVAGGAGMRVVVTYTAESKWGEFAGAERIVGDLQSGEVTLAELRQRRIVQDDRVNLTVTDGGIYFSSGGAGGLMM